MIPDSFAQGLTRALVAACVIALAAPIGCAPRQASRSPIVASASGPQASIPSQGIPPEASSDAIAIAPPASERASVPSPPPAAAPTAAVRELFPGLRIDVSRGLIELDATVPIDAHNAKTPRVFLELFVCPRDTKEHEAVAMTRVEPSRVHAALLLLGLEPGAPGRYAFEGKKLVTTPPTGPRVRVTIAYTLEGREVESSASDWAISTRDGRTLTEHQPDEGFVFAGSLMLPRQGREVYKADADGTLIGLTSFGSELIAWTRMHNPDASSEEPQWIANARVVPPVGTPLVVRIRPQ